MKRQPLRGHRDRKEIMATFVDSTQQDLDAGKPVLDEGIINKAFALNTEFQNADRNMIISYSLRRNAVAAHAERIDELSRANADFYETLERRNRRRNLPPGVVDIYKSPNDRGRPRGTTQKRVVQLSQGILEGELQAIDQQYPAMTNPSAEEIGVFLGETTVAAQTLTNADRDYQESQQLVQNLSQKVDQMVGDLNRAFQTATHDLSDSARRRMMRRYGFTFVQDGSEPLEPEVNTSSETESTQTNDDPAATVPNLS